MDDIFGKQKEKRGINPIFFIGIVIGLAVIGGAIWLLSLRPSLEEQTAMVLQGTVREGSPEFAELNKNILISKDDKNTVESPMGLGTISMFIRGNILNRTNKTITVLEVNVSVIDQQKRVVREKNVIVVPTQQPRISPDESVPITLALDGFDPKDDRANINFKATAIKAE